MQNFCGPLGQLQDSRGCAPGHSERDPDSDLNSLPICALSSPTKTADPDSWTHVKTRSHGHGKSNQLESRIFVQRPIHSRFAVLADMDKSFPVFNAEKQHVLKPRMSAFPKGGSQAASKSAVRKKKKEQKSLLIAPINECVNDPEFMRRADELRTECCAERLEVKADTRFGQRQILLSRRPN